MTKKSRAAHAAKVASRSAQSSGVYKCYVEHFELPDGRPDLRLREKTTRRLIRVLSDDPVMHWISPLANLMGDCYNHGRGLTKPTGRGEYIAVSSPVVRQDSQELSFRLHQFVATVHIQSAAITNPPVSVWCYIEEYSDGDGAMGVRLRQKQTGRKVEMYGSSKHHLAVFLASPQFTGARELMENLYEKDGFEDYVLVSGGTAVDSYDVIRYENGDDLTYLLGPTPDTAYRDAFRAVTEETAAMTHSRTATRHLQDGRYREAILSARLAVETASGGGGRIIARRVANAPDDVKAAADSLYKKRNVAVHESETRIEQQDAEQAVRAMNDVLSFLMKAS